MAYRSKHFPQPIFFSIQLQNVNLTSSLLSALLCLRVTEGQAGTACRPSQPTDFDSFPVAIHVVPLTPLFIISLLPSFSHYPHHISVNFDVLPQKEHNKCLVLFREVISNYFDNHKKGTNTMARKNANFYNFRVCGTRCYGNT